MNFAERFKDRTVFVGRDGGNGQLVDKVPPLMPTPPAALPNQQDVARARQRKSETRRGIYAPGELDSTSVPAVEYPQRHSSVATSPQGDHPYPRASESGEGRVPMSLDPKQLRAPQRNGEKERGNTYQATTSENGPNGNRRGKLQKEQIQRLSHNGNGVRSSNHKLTGAASMHLDIVNEDDRNDSAHLSAHDEGLSSVTRSPMGHYRSVSPYSQKSPCASSHFGASATTGTPTIASSRRQSILHAARQPREGSHALQYQRVIVAPPAPPIPRTSSRAATSPMSSQSLGCDSIARRPTNESDRSFNLRQRHSSTADGGLPSNAAPVDSMNHGKGSRDYALSIPSDRFREEPIAHGIHSRTSSHSHSDEEFAPYSSSESFRSSSSSSTPVTPTRPDPTESRATRRSTTPSTSLFKCTGLFSQPQPMTNTNHVQPAADGDSIPKRDSKGVRGRLSSVGSHTVDRLLSPQLEKRPSAARLSFSPSAVVAHQDAEEMGRHAAAAAPRLPDDARSVSYRRYLAGLQRNPNNEKTSGVRGTKANGRSGKTTSVNSRERTHNGRKADDEGRKNHVAEQRTKSTTRRPRRSISSASSGSSETAEDACRPSVTYKPHTLEDYKTVLRNTQTMKLGGLGFADTDEQREAKERATRAAAYAEVLRQKERMKLSELRRKREAAKLLEEQQAQNDDAEVLQKPADCGEESIGEDGTPRQTSREAQLRVEEENAIRAAKEKEEKLRYLMYYGNADNYVARRDSPPKEEEQGKQAVPNRNGATLQESAPTQVRSTENVTSNKTSEEPIRSPSLAAERILTSLHQLAPAPLPEARKLSSQKRSASTQPTNRGNKPPVQRRLKDSATAKKTQPSSNQSKPPLAPLPSRKATEQKGDTCVEVTLSPLKSSTEGATL